MIIKDNEGDWGICVAAWRGMKKGKAGIPGDYIFPNTVAINELLCLKNAGA